MGKAEPRTIYIFEIPDSTYPLLRLLFSSLLSLKLPKFRRALPRRARHAKVDITSPQNFLTPLQNWQKFQTHFKSFMLFLQVWKNTKNKKSKINRAQINKNRQLFPGTSQENRLGNTVSVHNLAAPKKASRAAGRRTLVLRAVVLCRARCDVSCRHRLFDINCWIFYLFFLPPKKLFLS